MKIALRALAVEDAPGAARIYNAAVEKRSATLDESPTPLAEFEAELRMDLTAHPGIAALRQGELVAYASSSAHSRYGPYGGIAEFSVYVAEEHRGRGIGRAVLAELIARCEAARFTKLLSRILAENVASRKLCASLGFREVGVYERHGRLEGAWRDVVIVKKLLGDAAKAD